MYPADWVSVFFGLTTLPGLITHSVPGAFIYIWIPLSLLVCTFYLFKPFDKTIFSPTLTWPVFFFNILRIYVLRTSNQLLAQLMFNYALLFYSHDLAYIDVIAYEFQLRNTACYAENYYKELRFVLSLVSYL